MDPSNNGEEPYSNIYDLLKDYGYDRNDIAGARKELKFLDQLLTLKELIELGFSTPALTGSVYAIQAPWGMGKTSFINILLNELSKSDKIDSQLLCKYYYDSLYYGNVSEAITIFINELFKKIEKQYTIKLRRAGHIIARNLTPELEFGGLFAKLRVSPSSSNDTRSIITDQVRDNLCKINGKIIIVIDDVDRLTSSEALHLLRMIRVLKAMPNTIILLPIDFGALVDMLDQEHVASPGGYVRKIITSSIRLRSDFDVNEKFFHNYCVAEFNDDKIALFVKDLWFGYLWELSLSVLNRIENRERSPVRIQMDTPKNSVEWEKAEILTDVAGRSVFLKKFFENTRTLYNSVAENYLIKFKVQGNEDLFQYYRYSYLAPQTTFDRFFEGIDFTVQLGGGLEIVGGSDGFTMELYKESDLLTLTGVVAVGTEAEKYDSTKAISDQLEPKKVIFWDLIQSVLEPKDLPKEILSSVSPRMIRRLIGQVRSAVNDEELKKLLGSDRTAVNNLYYLQKDNIRDFVTEFATQ